MLNDERIQNLMKELLVTELETQIKLAHARAHAVDAVQQFVDDKQTKTKEENEEVKLIMRFAASTPSVVSHALRSFLKRDAQQSLKPTHFNPTQLQHTG